MNEVKTPFELFDVECGKGWEKILEPIFNYIENYNKSHDEKIEIFQVKEKFGTLRFYTSFETEELSELISEAEDKSYMTCELCGNTDNVGSTLGWITTCCIDCVKALAKKNDRIYQWKPRNCPDDISYYNILPDGNIEKVTKQKSNLE